MNSTQFFAAFRKELHHLAPLMLALVVLEILGWVIVLSEGTPDTTPWSELSGILTVDNAEGAGAAYFIIGLVAAYMLFPHERENSTLNFLWCLPVERWKLFYTKVAAAFAVLLVIQLISQLNAAFVHSFNLNSISQTQFSWRLWWLELLLSGGVYFVGIGVGLLASWFRLVGVLAVVVYWVTVGGVQTAYPAMDYLNPASLLVPEYRGAELRFSAQSWAYHLSLAVICTVLAGALWTSYGETTSGPRKSKLNPRWRGALLVMAAFVLVVTYLSVTLLSDAVRDTMSSTQEQESLQVIETEFYQLSHYSSDIARAQLLQREADDLSRKVQSLLGITLSSKIVADLTDTSDQHLGIAGWKKLRIHRSSLYDADERSHVFVHETAHVLVGLGSDRRIKDHVQETNFFSEGLAEWAAYEVLDLDEQRHALRLLAATAWQRLDLQFDDLMHASTFRERYDENLIYAVGEAWVTSLAQVCGKQAPGAVVRAMAALGASKRQGREFWQATLRKANCSFSAVNARFARLMKDNSVQTNSVPVVRGGVERADGKIKVTLQLDGAATETRYTVIVRIRDSSQVTQGRAYSRQTAMHIGETKKITLPGPAAPDKIFQYQLGVVFIDGQRPYFGRWIDAS